jgi:hypothetical protein
MSRVRYPLFLILAIVLLTGSTLLAYGRIGAGVSKRSSPSAIPPVDAEVETPLYSIPTRADYERYSESDKAWREQNARQYTLAELRVRGDGRRSEREALDDRVFAMMKRGNQAGAVRELERWVAKHPRDRAALLALARLLRESGRTEASVARYRQLLSLGGE